MKKYLGAFGLIIILLAVFFGLNKISKKPLTEQNNTVSKQGIELNIYNAEITEIINNPSAPLAGNISVDLPTGSCINFKYVDPDSLNETPMSGCYSDRTKPLPNISEIAKGKKNINIYGTYDYTDCQPKATECVLNLIINKLEPIN
jgi:hypothetical protein